jgi:hypothetical protein
MPAAEAKSDSWANGPQGPKMTWELHDVLFAQRVTIWDFLEPKPWNVA